MARQIASACHICRRENVKLFLKGDRCHTDKCAFDRRPYFPGMRVEGRMQKPTEYGARLREKQKVKRMYGLMEQQFRNLFKKASRLRGTTADNFISLLERRLDNVVYRLGFARSIFEARQLVSHGHILVRGRKVGIPSYIVRSGEVIEVREKSRTIPSISQSLEAISRRGIPPWLELDQQNFKGVVKALPTKADTRLPIQEQLIVEYYSKV